MPLQDIGYAQTFEEAYERINNLYKDEEAGVHENPPVEDFLIWRDLRVFDGKFPSRVYISNTILAVSKLTYSIE